MKHHILGYLVFATLAGACSAENGHTDATGGSPNSSTGGQASGGTASGGQAGTSFDATGGTAAASGGSAGSQVGGAGSPTSGGALATGGVSTTGGAVATGGASASGGSPATGGARASGGAFVTGGASGAGGSAATGGATLTGGSPATGGSGGAAGETGAHWVGTWAASPYYDSENPPPASLSNSVLRQVVHVSLGGSQLRVQFSNLFGNGPVTLNAVHLALCKATPAVNSTIDVTTDKAVTFAGMASVTIAQGKEVWSDPVDFTFPALANVTITTAFGSVPSNVVGHSGSRTTSYLQTASTNVSAASMTSAQTTDHWYYISGLDVMAPAAAKAVVAIGDSITDGRGTDTNKNNRWTDVLSSRLQANAATANVAVLNQGIGATKLVGAGTGAETRFQRDVLGQSGIKYAIVFDGVNDIGDGATFQSMKVVYDKLIAQAHEKGVLIYGATLLPFGNNTTFYTVAHESVRQQVNTYVKSGVFDGIIDFEAALTDGTNPPKLKTEYATWAQQDGLHPGPAGYQKMGSSIDLGLFTR